MKVFSSTASRVRGFLFSSLAAVALAAPSGSSAVEAGVPEAQAVYGGRISDIIAVERAGAASQSRIFVSTESANSVFYADVDFSEAKPFATNIFSFAVVPDLDANAGFGSVGGLACHEASGRIFFSSGNSVLSCGVTAGSLTTNLAGLQVEGHPVNFGKLVIESSVLLAMGAPMNGTNLLYFGTLDADGAFAEGAGSPLSLGFVSDMSAHAVAVIHPVNSRIYVLDGAGAGNVRKSSDEYDALSGATTFADIALPAAFTNWSESKTLGIGPDGRLFVGSGKSGNKVIAYSDDDGSNWTEVETGIGGTSGANISTLGDAAGYAVFFGTAASTNKGVAGTWGSFPLGGTMETHANDGVVVADPVGQDVIYMTTDQGIGASLNGGVDVFEINQGVEAVQIQDFDMTDDKEVAWTASKSGIRRATNFKTSPQWIQTGMFPMGDGSPYYSIAVDRTDTNGTTVYAGNVRLYKTTDNGENWNCLWNIEGNTNGFENGGYFSAIEVDVDVVAAGFHDPDETKGGLLLSVDFGANFDLVDLCSGGIDVNDLLFSPHSTGLYVAVEYDASSVTGGVFYIDPTLTVVHDLTDAVSICDLAGDSSGGVYASGQAADNELVVYYKADSASAWTPLTTSGLPAQTQALAGRGPVITVGKDSANNDIPIIAVGVQLYYLPNGGTEWVTSDNMVYPNGTQINVLYWDELVVGTDTGIFGQDINVPPGSLVAACDFDGDGKSDIAVYHEASGYWYVILSSTSEFSCQKFGEPGYTPVPADYDSDGKTDIAVYHEASGYWFVQLSASDYALSYQKFGEPGYSPVAADYDGDGKADLAVYHEETGYWWVLLSGSGYALSYQKFGQPGYSPVPADYDGDDKTDIAVYHESSGYWYIQLSASGYALSYQKFGEPGYSPVAADYDGDGKADLAVYHEETGYWWMLLSGSGYSLSYQKLGEPGYSPVPGDYDGDGKADMTVYQETSGWWFHILSASSALSYEKLGEPGYAPVGAR